MGRADYLGQLKRGFGYAARHDLLPGIILILAVSQAFGGGLEGFWPVFAREVRIETSDIALFVGAIGASQGAGAALAHRARRWPLPMFLVLLAVIGVLLSAAAMVFQAWAVLLIVALAGIFKVIDVNLDARLHDAIPTEMRATLAATRNFAGLTALTAMLLVFGPLANATSYQAAFLVAGGTLAGLGAALFGRALTRRRR